MLVSLVLMTGCYSGDGPVRTQELIIVGDDDSATTEVEEVEAYDSEKPTAVTLGDASLTTGIPGDGELSVEQIQKWLADAANHKTLEVTLPLGLSAGAKDIKGLDANPLTRAKIELGRQLFFDGRLSSDGSISCASCHKPDHGYAAETQFGVGVDGQEGGRNSPVAYNRILSDKQFWDGRAETLEAQAVGPIANPIEMANTHEQAVATLKEIEGYRLQFDRVFDDGVTIDNVGRAIASFERAVVSGPSAFDYYEVLKAFAVFDDEDLAEMKEEEPETWARYEMAQTGQAAKPMSESATRGHELFFSDKSQCTTCHVGANLTDEKYHNIGVGVDESGKLADVGRHSETEAEVDRGAFKTPTIRNVALTPPYMHDGGMKTLMEVVEHYAKGGTPNATLSDKMKQLKLSDQDKLDLVAFMEACTGDFPEVETGRLP